MDQIWDRLWNAGIPLMILVVGIIWVATQWRQDMLTGYQQREAMIAALRDLSDRIDKVLNGKV